LLFIAMIGLARTCDSTDILICNALVMFMIYPWIRIKLKSANISKNPKTLM
jgi:hypothetical protein